MAQRSTLVLPLGAAGASTPTGSMLFIGNATVLTRYAGFVLLTHSTFVHMHEQAALGYGLHAMRLTNPAMEISQLPQADFVVLSHVHGGHFDPAAERELDRALPIVSTPESGERLGERGVGNTYPLATWSGVSFAKGDARLRWTAMPGRHGPPLADLVLPDGMGGMLEFELPAGMAGLRVYSTGDTPVIDDLAEIPRRYPEIDLALLHLGGTRMMDIVVTMDGEQGVRLLRTVAPKHAIPMRYHDYDLLQSPLSEFQQEVEVAGLADRVTYLGHGDTYTLGVPPRQ